MTAMLLAVLGHGWTPAGVAALVLAFILGGLVPVPRTAMVLAAGLVFGMPAVPIVVLSSTAGSVIAFLLARTLAREPARRRHAVPYSGNFTSSNGFQALR